MGDLTKADLEGKVVFVRADLNVSARQRQTESGPGCCARLTAMFAARTPVLLVTLLRHDGNSCVQHTLRSLCDSAMARCCASGADS